MWERTRVSTLYSQFNVLCGTAAMSKGRIHELAWWEVVMSRMLAEAKGALHLPRIASWLEPSPPSTCGTCGRLRAA
jgi:hypothetical protein